MTGEIGVDVEVVGFDVRDDSDGRRQREKRAIVFVGLHDVQLVAAGAEVSLPRGDSTADERRRVAPRGRERRRRHDGGRRFAVRAGNRDELATNGDLTQCLGTAHHGDAALARTYKLRMILGHRRRDDEGARAIDMTRIMRLNRDAESAQIVGAGWIRVAAGDRNAAAQEQLRERAHTRARDAYEVNRARIARFEKGHGKTEIKNIRTCSQAVEQREDSPRDFVGGVRTRARRRARGQALERGWIVD